MSLFNLPELPLSQYRAEFLHSLFSSHDCASCEDPATKNTVLLEAEPGAGKSTLAPLWVMESVPADQQVWLVQPRVLAAQALAQRLAQLVGEEVGQTVGFQVPFQNCSSTHTRLLLMTPGILLQHLLQNPTLDQVAVVMLDEIHERSVNQDTAWVWLQEVLVLREDLRVVLMSATPDPALQQKIPQRLFAAGRCFPVTTQFQPPKQSHHLLNEKLEDQLLRALSSHPAWQATTTLVFLPGWRDIEQCAQALQQRYPDQKILRLHSRVAGSEQAKALDPAQGPRIILSTNIAETSLTIADVTLVIDSGLVRRAEYEQRTGISRLRTARISQASADQRRGRAGRVQAGHCIRLWSQDQVLAPAELPEIRTTDCLPLALRLAHWGSRVDELEWLENPNALAMAQAQQQLMRWKLLTDQNKITAAGEQVSQLGTHPRIAVLLQSLCESDSKKISSSGVLLALALHFELPAHDNLAQWLEDAEQELKRNRFWQQQQRRWLKFFALELNEDRLDQLDASSLALAFNDRIGFRQESGRYRLNSGISVEPMHPIASPWAVFVAVQPKPKGHSGIALSVDFTPEQQRNLGQLKTTMIFKNKAWQRWHQWYMGGVVVAEQTEAVAAADIATELTAQLRSKIQDKGFESLGWSEQARNFLRRAQWVAQADLLSLPALDDEHLIVHLNQWLMPFLNAQTQLDKLPLYAALTAYVGYENLRQLDVVLPEKITLPSGRIVNIEFSADGVAQVAAKLQEFFGCENLQLAQGKIPLQIHLLSPNGSPLAITTDLSSFWRQAYADVRKQMRGRYPRHPWPENPHEHIATALTKRRLQNLPKEN